MKLNAKLLKRAEEKEDEDLLDNLVHYYRQNKPQLRALLNRPYPEDAIKKFLMKTIEEDVSNLIAPVFMQRAQDTLNDASLRIALKKLLDSPPAGRALEEDEFKTLKSSSYKESDFQIGSLEVNGRTVSLMMQSQADSEDEGELGITTYYLHMDWTKLINVGGQFKYAPMVISSWEDNTPPTEGDLNEAMKELAANFKPILEEEIGQNPMLEANEADILWYRKINESNITWDLE